MWTDTYVFEMLETDIGLMTGYRWRVVRIYTMCKTNSWDLNVFKYLGNISICQLSMIEV